MDQNDKIADSKITKLENEIKVLKNEVQAVLLDLRESYLNKENPFNASANPAAIQPIVISQQVPVRESKAEAQPEALPKTESAKTKTDSVKDLKEESLPITNPKQEIVREALEMIPNTHSELESRITPSHETAIRKNTKLDLITVAGLTGWVEDSTKKLGRERTEAILDISETMGYVYSDLKPILVKLIALAPLNSVENTSNVQMRDYMDSLIKLNSLLGNDNREESAFLLLSIINGDKNNG